MEKIGHMSFKVLKSGSSGNAYILKNEKDALLIEAGIPWKQLQKKMNFKTHELSACFCTHFHADHSGYIKDVLRAGIDTYTSRSVIDHYGLTGHRIHEIMPKKQFQISSFTVKSLPVPHDKDTPNMAFLLANGKDKFLFLVDCLYFPYFIPGLTGIGIGINFDSDILRENVKADRLSPVLARRIMSSHMSLATALSFFKNQDLSKVKQINILHCSESNLDKDKTKTEIQKLSGKVVYI